MGVRCDQKPMPKCNVWDMQTGHGSDVKMETQVVVKASSSQSKGFGKPKLADTKSV
jgi:hypothetical protein